ncbi:hypothetical protein DVH24_029766 [Malus domestica]|uniref:Uncharacterized protein n=1 Tax=Malus domestica TaxID=3750 RepID=A0A498HZK2_MALDO|nr:hypothetical protein DVH24_029766 [Malus domestica]
MIVAMELI